MAFYRLQARPVKYRGENFLTGYRQDFLQTTLKTYQLRLKPTNIVKTYGMTAGKIFKKTSYRLQIKPPKNQR
jgi:hypothetical protein